MSLLPRTRRDVVPLSPRVEGLLRGLPPVEAPDGLRTRLLAAYERGQPALRGSRWASIRFALLSGATAAGLVVAAGAMLRSPAPAAAEAPAWVAVHPMPATQTRVHVQEDARLVFGGPPATLAQLEPLEGPP